MKYTKPRIQSISKVISVVRTILDHKPGMENDGVASTGTAYEADE